ncbi:glutaredoxin family protein [Undibacterium umbellatum]|uniref:Glutaredoxin family protein n=1 Tax=Undibacterium umbellatum TaxID=2762300 RepID=A0ABR6ZHU4_9BURK|nr:glutaredoxin family protein [Undibacterium umbellatum]MBC3911301.1 glutaredoxin family protein [Undibacterium umbellatum]
MQTKYRKYLKDGFVLLATAALAVVLGSHAPGWYKTWQGPFKKGDYSVHVKSLPHSLTLYGTSTCPHCETARNYLKQAGIPFNDLILDQSKAATESYKQLGETGVPVLISENRMLVGFSSEGYAALVKTLSNK